MQAVSNNQIADILHFKMREKYPNMDFFHVLISSYMDWIRRFSEQSTAKTIFDALAQRGFWVIQKITICNLCKPFHNVIINLFSIS